MANFAPIPSPNHLIRLHQDRLWNRDAERFSGLHVYNKFEPGWLFDWHVIRIGTFEKFIDEAGSAAVPVARSVAAVLVGLDPAPRRIATALLAGRTTADELVAATGLTIAGVLAALTLLESRELVAGAYGRYRPVGDLASATPRRRPRRSPRRDPGGTTVPASPGRSGAV